MKRIGLLIASGAVAFGCQRDDTAIKEELADIKTDLADIKETLKSGGGRGAAAARPQRPQRPRPEPGEVYAAPIAGAPYEGPKDAKVTIVEAFEFA